MTDSRLIIQWLKRRMAYLGRPGGTWPFTVAMQWHNRKKISRRIESGAFDPSPTQFFYRLDYSRLSADEQIPKVFHYTWKNTNLPPFYRECMAKCEFIHPAPRWEHRLWTDCDMMSLVDDHFPTLAEKFRLLPKVIMQVDVFRYMLMYTHGGVYCDLDVVFYKPVDAMLSDCRLFLPSERDDSSVNHFIAQHFMASVPQHEFWMDLIIAILDHPRETILGYSDPITATGPVKVTKVWRTRALQYGAKIPRSVFFTPPTEYLNAGLAIPADTVSIHVCTGSWR